MQPAFTCQGAQGERPDHAVFTPGDETCTHGADDWPAGPPASWLVKFLFVDVSYDVDSSPHCTYLPGSSGMLSPSHLTSSLSSLGHVTPSATPQAAPSNKAEAVKFLKTKCPECQAQFSTKEEVTDHFQENKPTHSTVSLMHEKKNPDIVFVFI